MLQFASMFMDRVEALQLGQQRMLEAFVGQSGEGGVQRVRGLRSMGNLQDSHLKILGSRRMPLKRTLAEAELSDEPLIHVLPPQGRANQEGLQPGGGQLALAMRRAETMLEESPEVASASPSEAPASEPRSHVSAADVAASGEVAAARSAAMLDMLEERETLKKAEKKAEKKAAKHADGEGGDSAADGGAPLPLKPETPLKAKGRGRGSGKAKAKAKATPEKLAAAAKPKLGCSKCRFLANGCAKCKAKLTA